MFQEPGPGQHILQNVRYQQPLLRTLGCRGGEPGSPLTLGCRIMEGRSVDLEKVCLSGVYIHAWVDSMCRGKTSAIVSLSH